MCFDYDGEIAEFADTRIVKARKPHTCTACRGPIPAGETYERMSAMFDGAFFVDKLCRRCCYDRKRVVEHELAEGCHWSEAWPAAFDIVPYLTETGLGQTKPEDVPATYKIGYQPQEIAVR